MRDFDIIIVMLQELCPDCKALAPHVAIGEDGRPVTREILKHSHVGYRAVSPSGYVFDTPTWYGRILRLDLMPPGSYHYAGT